MAFPWIAVQLGLALGIFAVRWIDKKVAGELPFPKPRPQDLEFPQTAAGTPVPYVYGTCRVDNAVLVWNGNQRSVYDSSTGQFTYHVDLLYSLGVPCWDEAGAPWSSWRSTNPPKLIGFWVGDVHQPFGAPITHGAAFNVGSALSGGHYFLGRMEFLDGRADQTLSGTETSAIMTNAGVDATRVPGFRHQLLVGVRTAPGIGTIGYSPRVPSLGFEVRCLGPQPVNDDANPAWVIYDLLCAPVFRLGIAQADVDLTSFTAAATTLANESHGCSLVIYSAEDAASIIAGLLAQIDGVLFEDPSTGKLTLKLIRLDYNPAELPVLTTSNTIGRPKINAAGWRGKATGVNLTFTNRVNHYRQDVVQAGRLANVVAVDGRRTVHELSFPGVTTAALAAQLAARELAVMSRPLMTVEVALDRSFYGVLPGDALKAAWPALWITDKIFRVLAVDYGQLADGAITLTLIEDVFGQTAGAFPGAVYEPALPYLLPIHERYLTEAPYWMLQKLASVGTITSADHQRIFAMAANPDDTLATSFSVDATNPFDPDGPLMDDAPNTVSFMRYGEVITAAYPRTAEPYDTTTHLTILASTALDKILTIGLLTASDADMADGRRLCALVHPDGTHEFIAFKDYVSLGSQQWSLRNVWRGLMDTAPLDHPVGTRFFYLSDYANQVGRRGRAASTIRAEFIPAGGVLEGSGDEPVDALTIVERGKLPLPAANFTLYGDEAAGTTGTSGAGLKAVSSLDAEFQIAASRRLRTSATITRGDAAAETPEAGTAYDVVAQKVASNGLAFDAPEVTVFADLSIPAQDGLLLGGAGHGSIDVKLRTKNAGKTSWANPTVRVEAAHYRNLLCNGRAQDDDGLASTLGWTVSSGGLTTGTGGPAGAAVGFHFTGVTAAGTTVFYQDVDLAGYLPGGLSATLAFYWKNMLNGDSDPADTVTVTLQPLTAAGAETGTPATFTTVSSANLRWSRSEVTVEMPYQASKLRVTVTLTATGVSDPTAQAPVTEMSLRVGQTTGNLLQDPSFEL